MQPANLSPCGAWFPWVARGLAIAFCASVASSSFAAPTHAPVPRAAGAYTRMAPATPISSATTRAPEAEVLETLPSTAPNLPSEVVVSSRPEIGCEMGCPACRRNSCSSKRCSAFWGCPLAFRLNGLAALGQGWRLGPTCRRPVCNRIGCGERCDGRMCNDLAAAPAPIVTGRWSESPPHMVSPAAPARVGRLSPARRATEPVSTPLPLRTPREPSTAPRVLPDLNPILGDPHAGPYSTPRETAPPEVRVASFVPEVLSPATAPFANAAQEPTPPQASSFLTAANSTAEPQASSFLTAANTTAEPQAFIAGEIRPLVAEGAGLEKRLSAGEWPTASNAGLEVRFRDAAAFAEPAGNRLLNPLRR